MYQMLVGVPPFSHPSVSVTKQKILAGDYSVDFPWLSLVLLKLVLSSTHHQEMRDLLVGLLTVSPKRRLDVKQIKRHPFFDQFPWGKVGRQEIKPQFRPFPVFSFLFSLF